MQFSERTKKNIKELNYSNWEQHPTLFYLDLGRKKLIFLVSKIVVVFGYFTLLIVLRVFSAIEALKSKSSMVAVKVENLPSHCI